MSDLRLGIRTATARSPYWKVTAASTKPDLYLAREDSGQFVHVSLHGEDEWHLSVTGHPYRRFAVAPPDEQGVRLAGRVSILPSACRLDNAVPESAELIEHIPGTWIHFMMFLVGYGSPIPWVPDGLGFAVLDMQGGRRCCTWVVRGADEGPHAVEVHAPLNDHDRIRDQLNSGAFGTLLMFQPSEGGFWVVDTGFEVS